jgi:ankyrin repeat protein
LIKNLGETFLRAARLGLINVVKFLESPQYHANFCNLFGDSMLHYAVRGESLEMVQYLLLSGANPQTPNKLLATPIYTAVENGNLPVFKLLCYDKRTLVDHQDKFGDTILHAMVRENRVEMIKEVLLRSERLPRLRN